MAAEAWPAPSAAHSGPAREGKPAHGCPWHWSVYRWLDGQNLTVDSITDAVTPATELAQFVAAPHRVDRTGARRPVPE